jgi:Cu(I)/Ag(I) efflux system protein CusF
MTSKIKTLLAAAFLSVGASSWVAAAEQAQANALASPAAGTASLKLTTGEVRKVDTEQGKVTIKHEAIENLEMPAMTMVFKASTPDLLKNIKAGDKIQFRAETVAGAMTVTNIQQVK